MYIWLVYFELFEKMLRRLMKHLIFLSLCKEKNCVFPLKLQINFIIFVGDLDFSINLKLIKSGEPVQRRKSVSKLGQNDLTRL